MSIDKIREDIAISMNSNCDNIWTDILNDTDPGHYGIEDIEFQIDPNDIWVDIPVKTFNFKNGTLTFSARLVGSSDRDGIDKNCELQLSGNGEFSLESGGVTNVDAFQVNERLDIF